MNKIQADLGNLLYTGREAEAVLELKCLREAIKSIDKTVEAYKAYMTKLQEAKEKEQIDQEALVKAIAEAEAREQNENK